MPVPLKLIVTEVPDQQLSGICVDLYAAHIAKMPVVAVDKGLRKHKLRNNT